MNPTPSKVKPTSPIKVPLPAPLLSLSSSQSLQQLMTSVATLNAQLTTTMVARTQLNSLPLPKASAPPASVSKAGSPTTTPVRLAAIEVITHLQVQCGRQLPPVIHIPAQPSLLSCIQRIERSSEQRLQRLTASNQAWSHVTALLTDSRAMTTMAPRWPNLPPPPVPVLNVPTFDVASPIAQLTQRLLTPPSGDSKQADFEYALKAVEMTTEHHPALNGVSKIASIPLLAAVVRDLLQMTQVMGSSLGWTQPAPLPAAASTTADKDSARLQQWQNSASVLALMVSSGLVKVLSQHLPKLSLPKLPVPKLPSSKLPLPKLPALKLPFKLNLPQLLLAGGAFYVSDKYAREGATQLHQSVHSPAASSPEQSAPNRLQQVIDVVAFGIQVAGLMSAINMAKSGIGLLAEGWRRLRTMIPQSLPNLGQGLRGIWQRVVALGQGFLSRAGSFVGYLLRSLRYVRGGIAGLMMLAPLMSGVLAPFLPVLAAVAAVGAAAVAVYQHWDSIGSTLQKATDGIKGFFGFGDDEAEATKPAAAISQVQQLSDEAKTPLLQTLQAGIPMLGEVALTAATALPQTPVVVPTVTPQVLSPTGLRPANQVTEPASGMASVPSVVIENIQVQTQSAITSEQSEGLQQRIQNAIQDFFIEQQTAARGDYLCPMT
jgi:hypothetical protein